MSWDNTPIIDSVQLPGSDTKYFVADAEAREKIDALVSATHFIGVSSTEITDGGNESPTVGGETITPAAGDIVIYKPLTGSALEFIWDPSGNQAHPNGCWQLLGGEEISGLGDMAYADTASTNYTPNGTITYSTSSTTRSDVKGFVFDVDIEGLSITFDEVYDEPADLYINGTSYDLQYTSSIGVVTGITIGSSEGGDPSTATVLDTNYITVPHPVFVNTTGGSCTSVGTLPTISNTMTMTASIGGSTSSTLILSLTDMGFDAGSFPTYTFNNFSAFTSYTTSDVYFETTQIEYLSPSDLSSMINTATESIKVDYFLNTSLEQLKYKAELEGSLDKQYASIIPSFAGTTSTITVAPEANS